MKVKQLLLNKNLWAEIAYVDYKIIFRLKCHDFKFNKNWDKIFTMKN